MVAAIYLIAYELLKSSIIEEVKKMFFVETGCKNSAMQRHYASDILSLDVTIQVG
jgi:hypothetical protein